MMHVQCEHSSPEMRIPSLTPRCPDSIHSDPDTIGTDKSESVQI